MAGTTLATLPMVLLFLLAPALLRRRASPTAGIK